MNPRQGPLARIHHIREASWGVDPTTPTEFLIPFTADNLKWDQPRTPGVFYDGVASSKGSYKEKIDFSGSLDTSLDFHYLGVDLMDVLGSSGYTRVGSLHRWTSLGNPLPHQIRKEFTQATAIVHRYPGVIARSIQFAQAVSGQQVYTLDRLGKGDQQIADIAGATLSDTSIKKVNSYFNGSLTQDGVLIGNTAAFDFMVDRKVTGKDGIFQAGMLAAYSIGIPKTSGKLGKIFSTDDGDTFFLLGFNETPSAISCIWANRALGATPGPSMFLRVFMDAVLFDASAPAAGGETIPDQIQPYLAQQADSGVYHAAHSFGSILGPYTLSGSNNIFSAKPEGGATLTSAAMGTGSKTAAQLATFLNADATVNPKFTFSDLNGRLEYASKDITSASSVQWQTATANSAHTVLGFDATTYTGYAPSEIYVELYNDLSVDYL